MGPVQQPLGAQRRWQQARVAARQSPWGETLSQKKGALARETPAQDQALSQVDVHLLRDDNSKSFIILNHHEKIKWLRMKKQNHCTQDNFVVGAICLNLDNGEMYELIRLASVRQHTILRTLKLFGLKYYVNARRRAAYLQRLCVIEIVLL